MATFSALSVTYIIVQLVSLVLLLYLMIVILRSKSLFLKWTLLQLCISAFSYGVTSLPPIMTYGDDLISRAFETPLCIVMQKVSLFFIYPLEFFSVAIAIYLWFWLALKINLEKKYFWHISIAIWVFTAGYNGIILIFASKNVGWDVIPTKLDCKISKSHGSFYGYIISTSILAFTTFLMSCHSSTLLWKSWKNFNNNMNRRTAIRLGETVRLCTWCFVYIIWTLLLLIPRILANDQDISKLEIIMITMRISNFNSALIGTYLFLIFGTERKAAWFLPCYYVPPGTPQVREIESPDVQCEPSISSNDENNLVIKSYHLRSLSV